MSRKNAQHSEGNLEEPYTLPDEYSAAALPEHSSLRPSNPLVDNKLKPIIKKGKKSK